MHGVKSPTTTKAPCAISTRQIINCDSNERRLFSPFTATWLIDWSLSSTTVLDLIPPTPDTYSEIGQRPAHAGMVTVLFLFIRWFIVSKIYEGRKKMDFDPGACRRGVKKKKNRGNVYRSNWLAKRSRAFWYACIKVCSLNGISTTSRRGFDTRFTIAFASVSRMTLTKHGSRISNVKDPKVTHF